MVNSGKKEAVILFLGDLAMFVFSLWLTLFFRYNQWPDQEIFVSHLEPFLVLFVFWALVFFISGLYDKHTNAFKQKLPGAILNAEVINIVIAALFFYFIPYYEIAPKINLLIYLLITVALTSAWRILLVDYIYLRRAENVLLVGAGPEVSEIDEEIKHNKKYGLTILRRVPALTESALADISKRVFTIIMDLNKRINDKTMADDLSQLIFSNVRFIDLNDLYENIFDKVVLSNLDSVWFLKNVSSRQKLLYDFFKRIMDIVISLVVGVFALVLFPFVYLAIKLDDGGGVFIVQDRIGMGNRIMNIIKYRSMRQSDGGKWLVKDDKRVTRVGKFIRKYSIDELPQFFNILIGEMSLVGPRAYYPYELEEQQSNYPQSRKYVKVILSGKPGLTGVWQVTGRSEINFDKRVIMDAEYVKKRSILYDFWLIMKTIPAVISGKGAV